MLNLTYLSDIVGEDVLKIFKRKLRVSGYNNLECGSEVRLIRWTENFHWSFWLFINEIIRNTRPFIVTKLHLTHS